MDMHEVEGGSWGSLHDESDISRNEISGANLVDENSGLEVISFSKEMVKGVGELGGKYYCFPFGVVGGGVKVGHGVMETFTQIGVR